MVFERLYPPGAPAPADDLLAAPDGPRRAQHGRVPRRADRRATAARPRSAARATRRCSVRCAGRRRRPRGHGHAARGALRPAAAMPERRDAGRRSGSRPIRAADHHPLRRRPVGHPAVRLPSSACSSPGRRGARARARAGRGRRADDAAEALAASARAAWSAILCEGGPTLNRALLAAGVVDELFLTLDPSLRGGDGLRLLEGEPLTRRCAPSCCGCCATGTSCFLRYAVI